MSLNLVRSSELIKKVTSYEISFSELNKDQQEALISRSVVNRDFSALKAITNEVTCIYEYDEHAPYWLESNFFDDVWLIKLVRKVKVIRWSDIILDDGLLLTAEKHKPLLNAFKYWIVSQDNPLENGGLLQTANTIRKKIVQTINLINVILLHQKTLGLSEQHLSRLSNDFVMDVLCRMAKSYTEKSIYDYHSRLRKRLIEEIKHVNDEDAARFKSMFPFASRQLLDDECELGLTVEQRIKACCWLYQNDCYNKSQATHPTPIATKLSNVLFKNIILCIDDVYFRTVFELQIKEGIRTTEYRAMSNQDDSNQISEDLIYRYISLFKMLASVNDKANFAFVSVSTFKNVNIKRVQEHAKMKAGRRFMTLSAPLIFRSVQDAFEFCFEHEESILDSIFDCFNNVPQLKKITVHGIGTSTQAIWRKEGFKSYVMPQLLKRGVDCFCIATSDPDRFYKRRKNKGLVDLYDVLLGSIQILVGALVARRQDELIQLKPYGNLSPNLDPESAKGKITDYSLTFNNKKSGIGGKHSHNEKIERPIPRSIALFIFRLENFNQKLIQTEIPKNNKLGLFNNIDTSRLTISKPISNTYNDKLDAFCDYFETNCVRYEYGELRRYYIRQHQLRRFFAMVFFWSNSFDGLDTLRWMLGHTDMEHLYHYVTEAQPGETLNGIKANYLVNGNVSQKLSNIEELNKVLAKRYGVNAANISLSSISEAIDDFEDTNEYITTPSISEIEKQKNLENQILKLFDDKIIELEPEFFTIKSKDGTERQGYHLIFKVNELD